ncbi:MULTISPECIES: hypothetical protein [unclassified Pseudomonas]|uniref:hypothetical protein n=1 Tax=unclassified Pseudomonas TaxID=196821 RepID=UPI0025D383E5|nr:MULTISPECIES: hypothetical protein [unclassified Pseudomonas]
MSQFTGKVVKRNLDQRFGWIKYAPPEEKDDADVDDEIYFTAASSGGTLPPDGAEVTFTREVDLEKPGQGEYIATNVQVIKVKK